MNDVSRRIRAAVRPGPPAFAGDCSLLLLMPRAAQASAAVDGFAHAHLGLFVYAVASPTLALDYLRGRDRHLGALPLILMIDADPLTAGARKLLAEVRRDAHLKYLTVVLLHENREPEADGAAVTLHVLKPADAEGYKSLALDLRRLLPVAS